VSGARIRHCWRKAPHIIRTQMNAVRAEPRRQGGVARDQEQEPARLGDGAKERAFGGAPRVVIVAIDDGGPARQRAQDKIGTRDAALVGHERRRERGLCSARRLEGARGGC
jgi:hypothetical protein